MKISVKPNYDYNILKGILDKYNISVSEDTMCSLLNDVVIDDSCKYKILHIGSKSSTFVKYYYTSKRLSPTKNTQCGYYLHAYISETIDLQTGESSCAYSDIYFDPADCIIFPV